MTALAFVFVGVMTLLHLLVLFFVFANWRYRVYVEKWYEENGGRAVLVMAETGEKIVLS